ncbi:hypothetical protein CC2G_005043 [Coprinopsis cinerea AmutBmut pab1-1]|nr:hypothetical protein CC2G_005043 [Coprinopsis cinerea AmutBmut pab1-1]
MGRCAEEQRTGLIALNFLRARRSAFPVPFINSAPPQPVPTRRLLPPPLPFLFDLTLLASVVTRIFYCPYSSHSQSSHQRIRDTQMVH